MMAQAKPAIFGGLPTAWDVVLCDIFGTLHSGSEIFPDAVDALRGLKRAGAAIILLSNSARPGHSVAGDLAARGMPADCFDDIVSSADVARAHLAEGGFVRAHHIGGVDDRALFAGLAIDLTPVEEAEVVVCTAFPDTDSAPTLDAACRAGIALVCTDPATSILAGTKRLRFPGLVALAYRECGGRVVETGKPGAAIYRHALAAAERHLGWRPSTERVLGIGDSQDLDVAGALAQGYRALWIAGDKAGPLPFPACYRMPRLSW